MLSWKTWQGLASSTGPKPVLFAPDCQKTRSGHAPTSHLLCIANIWKHNSTFHSILWTQNRHFKMHCFFVTGTSASQNIKILFYDCFTHEIKIQVDHAWYNLGDKDNKTTCNLPDIMLALQQINYLDILLLWLLYHYLRWKSLFLLFIEFSSK